MQTKREPLGYEMMLLPSLEEFVPADHRLRKLNRVLDLSFIHDTVRDRYCQDNGCPSIDPEVVLRLFLLQAIAGIRSIRELMNEVHVNLAYRWFIGYRVDEELPDHSTLSRALDRFGDAVFNDLFRRSVAQCQGSGLVEGKVLYLDATMIRADLNANRVGPPDSPNPDARFGRGPGGRKIPGYKQQTVVDGKARVVVAVSVLPGNAHDHQRAVETIDQAIHHIGQTPDAVCADAAYANGPNAAAMEERGIRLVSPPRRIDRTGRHAGRFTTEDFIYDETRDVYVCPADQTLTYIGTENTKKRRRRYRAPCLVCTVCQFHSCCTKSDRKLLQISPHHDSLQRLRADAKTDSFRALYRARFPVSEGVFAEEKQWHGLRRAWRRGLSNMLIQSLLVATVINFKRLMSVDGPMAGVVSALRALLRVIRCAWHAKWVVCRREGSETNGMRMAA